MHKNAKSLKATATLPSIPFSMEKYQAFLHWYSISPDQKVKSNLPNTIPEYLTANNLSIEELQSFYKKESFADDVVEATVKWAKTKTAELVHILYDRYKERRSPQDFNAFVEFITKINSKEKANQTQVNIFNINDEQYRQIISRESRIIQQGDPVVSLPSSQE